jgi:hypothetical protein
MKKEELKFRDPLTGEEFVPLRSNQKYASRATQIKYNNELAKQERKKKSNVDGLFRRTHRALAMILGGRKECNCSRDFLLGAGVSFGIFTHHKTINGTTYYCVYEYCYTTADQLNYKIIKDDEYK